MKKLEGKFVPNKTDIKRAKAHARAIAKNAHYSGSVEVWFDSDNGEFHFHECVGSNYIVSNQPETYYFVAGYRFDIGGTVLELAN